MSGLVQISSPSADSAYWFLHYGGSNVFEPQGPEHRGSDVFGVAASNGMAWIAASVVDDKPADAVGGQQPRFVTVIPIRLYKDTAVTPEYHWPLGHHEVYFPLGAAERFDTELVGIEALSESQVKLYVNSASSGMWTTVVTVGGYDDPATTHAIISDDGYIAGGTAPVAPTSAVTLTTTGHVVEPGVGDAPPLDPDQWTATGFTFTAATPTTPGVAYMCDPQRCIVTPDGSQVLVLFDSFDSFFVDETTVGHDGVMLLSFMVARDAGMSPPGWADPYGMDSALKGTRLHYG